MKQMTLSAAIQSKLPIEKIIKEEIIPYLQSSSQLQVSITQPTKDITPTDQQSPYYLLLFAISPSTQNPHLCVFIFLRITKIRTKSPIVQYSALHLIQSFLKILQSKDDITYCLEGKRPLGMRTCHDLCPLPLIILFLLMVKVHRVFSHH